ncbi:MAG: homoserine O-acetyltransferase [Microscillaceae bacterium]|nr:homoserine O-acetyltransferase [Microscillaceae bacterium]
MEKHTFVHSQAFALECGESLPELRLAYTTLGQIQRDPQGRCRNVVWVCHALTANAEAADWWAGMIGPGKCFDPQHHFIICANMLGSCYGSTYALSPHPHTGKPYFHAFPLITVRDIARSLDLLRAHLGIDQIQLCIGGSMGGQQALEWAILEPTRIARLVVLATNARHSAWGIAFNEAQRMAIAADATWGQNHPEAGLKGMRAARALALLSYRNYQAYGHTQTDPQEEKLTQFKAASYQQYQGDKLMRRFDAFAYWALSRAMDSHHLGRYRGGLEAALRRIEAQTLVVGIASDLLFPVSEQQYLAAHIPQAKYLEIDSPYGHDGFLIEFEKISQGIREWEASRLRAENPPKTK